MTKIGSFLKTYIKPVAITLPTLVAFVDYVAYVAKVDGVSMQPTFNESDDDDDNTRNNHNNNNNQRHHSHHIQRKYNDFVFLSHISVRKYSIKRGQIVALISPQEPNQKIIKRVVALEGDTVVTRPNCKRRKVVVPQGHCWVEGDNHSKSMDSNVFGPVAVGLITAKAICIVWPPKRWQMLESIIPHDRTAVYYPNNSCLLTCNFHSINSDDSVGLIE